MSDAGRSFHRLLNLVLGSLEVKNPTHDQLRRHVSAMQSAMREVDPEFEDVDTERLLRELEARLNVFQPASEMLTDDSDHIPWLPNKAEGIAWKFWNRYSRHLRENEGLPPVVLQRIDESTRKVLEHLEDPSRPGLWSRRGLVAGQVQSGKTGHFIGLMCKAIDAGYRVVVVLSGVDNNLRSQTQLRVDAGLLGFDTQRRKQQSASSGFSQDALGAGQLIGESPLPIASLTSSLENGDFKKAAAAIGVRPDAVPLVAVVKKNVTVLRNLREWLVSVCAADENGKITDQTVFLIDDEADSASVNTRGPDTDPAAVNREIRWLLNSFSRSSYVGYSATPYANIYINPDADHDVFGEDLYPRSFIETYKAPSNYFGPSRLFGADSGGTELPLHRPVVDYSSWIPDKHKKDHAPAQLPDSLTEAIKSFVLSRAARLSRGQDRVHNSMLIHVTRFNALQKVVREQVERELELLKARIKFGDGDRRSIREDLQQLWEEDFVNTSLAMASFGYEPIRWQDIEPQLIRAVDPIAVRSINGDARDTLDYFDNRQRGFNVIAIGGNKLSRGLTLEGLTVSYYLRTTRMFDTLLQMGRWFGYRPGYEDLCRLYTTERLWKAYDDVAKATAEMYQDFDEMCDLGKSPSEYGLKVRNSVEQMIVTSPSKMRFGERLKIGFAGGLSPSTSIHADKELNSRNLESLKSLISDIQSSSGSAVRVQDSEEAGFQWGKVAGERVAQFFDGVKTPDSAYRVNSTLLARFIRGRVEEDHLIDWTVFLASPRNSQNRTTIGKLSINHTTRSMPTKQGGKEPTSSAINRLSSQGLYTVKTVVSPSHEIVDFSSKERAELLRETLEDWEAGGKMGKPPVLPRGAIIRKTRPPTRGLLMLYLISSPLLVYHDQLARMSGSIELSSEPLVGFAVSFPRIDGAPAEDYVVTQQFMKELREVSEDLEEDEES